MKALPILIFSFFLSGAVSGQTPAENKISAYWLVILKTGPKDKEIVDTAQRNKLFAGHFANMKSLHKQGILKAAGPFGKNDNTWRGLFILDCNTKEEAENSFKQTHR